MSDHSKGDGPGSNLNFVSGNYVKGIGLDEDGDDRIHSLYDYNDSKGFIKLSNDFCSPSSKAREENFTSEMEIQNSSSLPEVPSTEDAIHREELENTSNDGKLDSQVLDMKVKELCSNEESHVTNIPQYELEELTVEASGKTFSSSKLEHVHMETVLDSHHSVQDSPSGTPKHFIPPFSSPKSPVGVNLGYHDPSHLPSSNETKHFSLSERSDQHKGVISHDQLLLSHVQTSISGQGSPRISNHGSDSSPKLGERRKRSKIDYSTPKRNRKERSVSRSPPKRRDSSRSHVENKDSRSPSRRSSARSPIRHREVRDSRAGQDYSRFRRDYRNRSRSWSPYRRDHHREAAAGPRRRFPPVGSRGSPRRKRAWSPPSNRSNGLGKAGKNLFVAGFSFMTREKDLERKFCKFGHVTNVRIVRDKRCGDSRGFGFISMKKDEEADAAIKGLDETEWNGRIILVEKSKTSDHQ